MSLFYDKPTSVNVAFVARDDDEAAQDTFLVGQILWDSLATNDATDRICISISNITKTISGSNRLPSISTWAFLDENVTVSIICV